MATCKECVHNNICNIKQRYNHPKYALQHIEKYCEHFKDRSRFVDITEIKQNVIRPLCNRCAALTDCQTCLACALEIREHCDHYKQIEQALKEREDNV